MAEPSKCTLTVRVTPRASRERIEPGDPLRVYVTSPPADGAANEAVVALLAKRLRIAKGKVAIVAGHTSRVKKVAIEGVTLQDTLARLTNSEG